MSSGHIQEPQHTAGRRLRIVRENLTDTLLRQSLEALYSSETDPRPAVVQRLSKNEEELVRKYNPEKQIPFLLIGGRFMQVGSGFTPKIFIGHTFRQTQSELKKNESEIRRTIDEEASKIAALLCVSGLPPELCKETGLAELVAQANSRVE